MKLSSTTKKAADIPEKPKASVTVSVIGLSTSVTSIVDVFAPVD